MAIIKEYREFFLRHVQTNSGSKPDQENGFATQYSVEGSLKYNRFLKGDYPSQSVFQKLFESITFKLNVEDTASTTQQGLVKVATDANARTRTSASTGQMKTVVEPHQLPEVTPKATLTVNFTGDTTSGSDVITNVDTNDLTGLVVGATITGNGIPAGAFVESVDFPNEQFTISANATATASGVSLTQTATDVQTLNTTRQGINIKEYSRTISGKLRKIYQVALDVGGSLFLSPNTQKLQLENDEDAPGSSKFYGTDTDGTRGWFASQFKTGVKVYRALISQSSTSAPTAKVLDNTVGTITYTRVSAGVYKANSSALFTQDKTFARMGQTISSLTIQVEWLNTSEINIQLGSASDDELGDNPFEIFVYP